MTDFSACFSAQRPSSAGQFTGKERDAETGLDYFGARYLSSPQGRFTTPDPLMASAKIRNPQTWNRYSYALNNPLRFVDPDGLDVPESCAESEDCKIRIKINVVYNSKANSGKGLTKNQKKEFEKEQIENAKKDFANSNIELDVTYGAGTVSYDSAGKAVLTGGKEDALNVFVTSRSFNGSAGSAGRSNTGVDAMLVYADGTSEWNVGPFFGNTLEHEMGHTLLGHSEIGKGWGTIPRFFTNMGLDAWVNTRLTGQDVGIRQDDFRRGTMPKRYAVPANPEANKPQK